MNQAPFKTIAIIGGGVAGMSCALWLKHLGFTPIIIEQNTDLGGQLCHLDRINRWVLGMPNQTSRELAERYEQHINLENIATQTATKLIDITPHATHLNLTLKQNGQENILTVNAMVIATGVTNVGAEIFTALPGFETALAATLISFFPLDHLTFLNQAPHKVIAVVGGGDNAHYTALDLAAAGAKVIMLMRGSAKAKPYLRQQLRAWLDKGMVVEHTDTTIHSFHLLANKLELQLSNGQQQLVDKLFVRAGFKPNTEFLLNQPTLSSIVSNSGYINTDAGKCTTLPTIYAVGDVTSPSHQSVVHALADGALAAQTISERISNNGIKHL